jgi:hypothetical protein
LHITGLNVNAKDQTIFIDNKWEIRIQDINQYKTFLGLLQQYSMSFTGLPFDVLHMMIYPLPIKVHKNVSQSKIEGCDQPFCNVQIHAPCASKSATLEEMVHP